MQRRALFNECLPDTRSRGFFTTPNRGRPRSIRSHRNRNRVAWTPAANTLGEMVSRLHPGRSAFTRAIPGGDGGRDALRILRVALGISLRDQGRPAGDGGGSGRAALHFANSGGGLHWGLWLEFRNCSPGGEFAGGRGAPVGG